MGKLRNKLGQDQRTRLAAYLMENRERFNNVTASRIARCAMKVLGFDVTRSNVMYLRADVGIKAPARASHGVKPEPPLDAVVRAGPSLFDRVRGLEERLRFLEEQLGVSRGAS